MGSEMCIRDRLIHWSEDFQQARSRALDICEMKGHLERACTRLLSDVDISGLYPQKRFEVDFRLLLAGYSSQQARFYTWVSTVDPSRRLTFEPPHRKWRGLTFIGDNVDIAWERLAARIGAKLRSASVPRAEKVPDWEPLDVLVQMIRDPLMTSIGGPPQLVKIYPHLDTMAYAIAWGIDEGTPFLTLRGRPLLDYEQTQRLAHDIETHENVETWRYRSGWLEEETKQRLRTRLVATLARRPPPPRGVH